MPFKPVKKVEREFNPVRKASSGGFVDTAQGDIDPTLSSEAKRMIGATAGGIGGGMVGGAPGAIAGAMLGGAGAEGINQLGQKISGSPETPKSTLEAIERMGKSGVVSGAEELVGYGIFKGVGKMLAPFKKYITKEGMLAHKTLSKYMPKKTPAILPAEMTEHRGLDILHNIAENSVFGSRRIAIYKDITRRNALNSMVDELSESFGKTVDSDVLGETIADVATGKWKRFKETVTTPIYNEVERLTAAHGPIVSTKNLKAAVKGRKISTLASDASGDNIVKAVNELDDFVDVATARDLKTRLMAISDEFSISNKKAPAIGLSKHLTGILDSATETALKETGGTAYDVWRLANTVYKEGSKELNNRTIRRLVKMAEDEPERVLNAVFKNGGITGLKRTKNVVGNELWNNMKTWYVRDVLNKSTMQSGVIDGEKLLSKLYRKTGGMGEESLNVIFDKAELQRIKSVATALKVAQQKQASGSGGMLIQLTQATALAGLVVAPGATLKSASSLFLVGPEILSRLMTSKSGSKWLSYGLSQTMNTPQFNAAFARLTHMAAQETVKYLKENNNNGND